MHKQPKRNEFANLKYIFPLPSFNFFLFLYTITEEEKNTTENHINGQRQ